MIRFALYCALGHEFEGWFRDNEDFDQQNSRNFIACPICSNTKIQKALMHPATISSKKNKDALSKKIDLFYQQIRTIKKEALDVGTNFPHEARKIHFQETPKKTIIGQASKEDVQDLLDEGIAVLPLPILPEEKN